MNEEASIYLIFDLHSYMYLDVKFVKHIFFLYIVFFFIFTLLDIIVYKGKNRIFSWNFAIKYIVNENWKHGNLKNIIQIILHVITLKNREV